jgi:hypothetical protein
MLDSRGDLLDCGHAMLQGTGVRFIVCGQARSGVL